MKKLLAVLIALSALSAAPPKPSQVFCETIVLDIHNGAPFVPEGWIVDIKGVVEGPYFLFFGKQGAHTPYHGCIVGVNPDYLIGPLFGNFHEYAVAQPYAMAGYWQVVCKTQTSNLVHIVP